jgi:hypothetical protein
MKRAVIRLFCTATVVLTIVVLAEACGIDTVFRSYLSKTLWRPAYRYVAELARGLPREKTSYAPFAGMSAAPGNDSMQRLRNAYQNLFQSYALTWPDATIVRLRELARAAQPANAAEQNELELLHCKIDLRGAKLGDDPALGKAQTCFETYLKQTRPDALASEARGWLARTYFLRERRPAAAKIYLAELRSTRSNIRRQALLDSLGMLYPREGRPQLLKKDLSEYFDTPAHALFIADIVTNPNTLELEDPESVMVISQVAAELIARLDKQKALFRQGAESDALALTLMRAFLRGARRPPSSGMRTSSRRLRMSGSPPSTAGCSAAPIFLRRTMPRLKVTFFGYSNRKRPMAATRFMRRTD